MKCVCITAGTLVASAVFAQAAALDCPAPPGAVKIALPAGLPPPLREAIGDIALPGEPFDSTDVHVVGHKYGRYIFVCNAGNRWIVATERGGIALRSEILVYALGKNGKTVRLIDKRIGLVNGLCGAATKLAGQ